MKSSTVVLLIGTICQFADAEYIVPAYIDEKGKWFINVEIIRLGTTQRMELRMAGDDSFPHAAVPSLTARPESLRLPGISNGGAHQPFTFESVSRGYGPPFFVGVDPSSPLLASAGSVAMIQLSREGNPREGQVVIDSNFSSFNATCAPGSLMRLEIPSNEVGGTIAIGRSELTISSIILDSLPENVLAWVPRLFLFYVIDKLEYMDARSVRNIHPTTFSNCTRELVVASLPPIEVRMEDFGTLVLYPDEYIEFGTDAHCSLRLREAWERAPVFQVDILKLPNINVRISSNGIAEFCDAMVDPDYVGLRHAAIPLSSDIQPITAPPTQSRLQRWTGHLRRFLACLRIF